MVRKIPPPPMFTTQEFQAFNRWLLEVTSVLSNEGDIAASEVEGLLTAYGDILQNSLDIDTLETGQTGQAGEITDLQADIVILTDAIAAINGQITTLSARGELLFGAGAPAAGLGKVNDWYGDTAGAVGARVWVKKAVGVWTPFPF